MLRRAIFSTGYKGKLSVRKKLMFAAVMPLSLSPHLSLGWLAFLHLSVGNHVRAGSKGKKAINITPILS